MGKCGSKGKKMDANDVPYGMKEEKTEGLAKRDENNGGIVVNIMADKVSIGASGDMLKFKDDMFQNSNMEERMAKVCKQEPLKEIYVPTDEGTDGQIVTSSKTLNQDSETLCCTVYTDGQLSSKALNQEPYNAEKDMNKLCKEETDISELICTKHNLDDAQLADTKSNNEPSKTETSELICTEHNGDNTQLADTKSNDEPSKTETSELICTEHNGDNTQLADTKSNNEPSKTEECASSCQATTKKLKTDSTIPKQTSSNHCSLADSVEQDGSVLLDLRDLSSEDSNVSTVQCDINRCPRLTNDIDKLKDYTIVNKRSDIESSTTSSQLFGSGHTGRSTTNMTSNTNEGLLRSSENSPFTNQLDRTCHASNKQQMGNPFQLNKASLSTSVQVFTEILTNSDENLSPVTARVVEEQLASSHYTPSNNELSNYTSDITPGTSNDVPENDGTVVEENQIQSTNQSSVRTEDYERNSVGDGEVGENQEEEQEHQEVEEDHGEVTQGEVIQAENQEVEEDAEPSQEPAIIGEIYVGHNDNLDDQQLKENIVPFDVMKTIKMVTFDVGQYSMKQNYDIAMKGNNEVKIENGKVIGSTAQNISCVIKDIAIQSMKGQQCF